MADMALLDRAHFLIMQQMINTGVAPHYTDLAHALGLSMEEGKAVLHDLIDSGIPAWLHPQTDYIVSFPPFHNLPTQYRISIDGVQHGYAQCGFEALAVRWLFPGHTVRIDAPCLDCGDSLSVTMRDEEVLSIDPPEMVGYTHSQVGGSPETRAFR